MLIWIIEVMSHPTLHGALLICLRTTVVYLFLIGGLRLLGKRELGQMTIYDLVLMIVIANAVQNAMVGDDATLVGGLVSATSLLVLNRLFNFLLARSKSIERVMVGVPIVIMNHGKLLPDVMKREGITHEQIMAALREHGMSRPEDATTCIMEVDGTISVVPVSSKVHRGRRHYRALRLP